MKIIKNQAKNNYANFKQFKIEFPYLVKKDICLNSEKFVTKECLLSAIKDETNKVFQNGLGFRSQWFTKNELKIMLDTNLEPIPINIVINDVPHTFGNVFVDRNI